MPRPKIELKAGDFTITADFVERSSFVSRSTQARLLKLRVEFKTENEEEKSIVQDFMRTGQRVETIGANTEQTKRWRIGQNSTSYSSNNPDVTTFSWELLEAEELKIDKLVVDGWELTPYKYSEEFEDSGVLTIEARVELTADEERRLRALPQYFEVVRKGINDTPRTMRFGQLLWSSSDDEKYRIRLYLIDKAYDDRGFGMAIGQPQTGNVAMSAAKSVLRFVALTETLVSKGVLSREEAEQIQKVDDDKLDRQLDQHDRVKDLDDWLDRLGG